MEQHYKTRPGSRYPAGARCDSEGTNFCIFSRHANAVSLLLYQHTDSSEPFQVIELDPDINRTFFFWHVYVEALPAGIHYTWRVAGPDDTERSGFRFNSNKELLDPWAKATNDSQWDRNRAIDPADNSHHTMRAMVVKDEYDWQGDAPLNHALEDCVIYEMHVGGFSRHPSADVAHPGTFAAVIEKIPYLQELGITDVELMPIMAFDETDVPPSVAARGLRNYWGYSTHSFLSPHPRYCKSPHQGNPANEFRDMVKALHQADIGVLLDVVINHTAEGGSEGPTINFKGFANDIFYHLDPEDKRQYRNFTGCGNTVNCNHPLVTRFIVDCLGRWVRHMHVDGFRFDLASIFARGENGEPMYNAPLPWNIEFSRTLTKSTIIAEAWDAAGLYQVGKFPGYRWSEWNGRYRDVMRRFVRGDKGIVGEVATCMSGSSDLYQAQGRLPINSINFITSHDGFTLYDLASYKHKHNGANGEDNRDGQNDNFSWNCGVEGETTDQTILALRKQQAKNLMAVLFLSQGVPMILAGDEILRSQGGNNNAYCQDNAIGWLDWRLLNQQHDMFRFVKGMIAFRKRHPALRRMRFLTGEKQSGTALADITWHGPRLNEPLWSDPDAQMLAFTLAATQADEPHIHVGLNMASSAVNIELPNLANRNWQRAIDTAKTTPHDILEPHQQTHLDQHHYTVHPHSTVVFESRPYA